jgi:hypothetical protein
MLFQLFCLKLRFKEALCCFKIGDYVIMELVNSITRKLFTRRSAIYPSTRFLLITASALFTIKMLIGSPGFLAIIIIVGATALAWYQFRMLSGEWRWLSRFLILGLTACLTALWVTTQAEPAQAQFFFQAETFFNDQLLPGLGGGAGADAAVAIIFNSMRAIYLLYLAVAIIGVVNAVRQDEDWQTAARTPLLIFVAVTFADVLTNFIVGNA